ncbi:pentatricopeptide repeat-containing protein At3g26782, mitochondrial-like [Nymphaea colorata]|nr:pentatricopeptide repeat-containing protein At3g26782, mitochondrial-like [Nymphaea colorata]
MTKWSPYVTRGKAAKITAVFCRLFSSKAANCPPSSSRTKDQKHQGKNAFQWHTIIRNSAINGSPPQETIALFQQMFREGVLPNASILPLLLKACAALSDPYIGQQIHGFIAQLGFESDTFVVTALMDMYGKCSRLDDAQEVLDGMPRRDLVAWTTLISAFSHNGCLAGAFAMFSRMQMEGIQADLVTVASLLTACRSLDHLPQGASVHCLSIKVGFGGDIYIKVTLVDMYSKCGNLEDAVNVFNRIDEKDVVSWNALIAGFSRNGEVKQALAMFEAMKSVKTVFPNRITLLIVIPCCGNLGSCETAKCVHGYVVKQNFSNGTYLDDVALATALVDMHSKCGNLELAHAVFNRIKRKNVVSWSAMIGGYEQALMPEKALQLFHEMLAVEGAIRPNEITMMGVLSACSQLGASRKAKLLHGYVTEIGLGSNSQVQSAVIDMYAKCGNIEIAREIFSEMMEKSVVSWSAMIGAEGMHGGGRRALELFKEMVQHGLQPNEVTFISLLSACSHSGLVNEGYKIFRQMEKDYGIKPALKHYGCMVDILGRAGRLDEAYQLIKSMPMAADAGVWGSLLGACRLYGNCKLGELVEKQILLLNPYSIGHRVLLANMYAAAGRWDDVVRTRVSLKDQGLKKVAGCSFIEIKNKIHKFTVEDRTHPDAEKIFRQLTTLDLLLKDAGYVPNTAVVAYNIDEKLKEHIIMYHSEKLAIAFGILNTRRGEKIRISKNLRICDDCHTYSKLISKVMKRELVIRDAYRFHHFKEGSCSCRDYW